ncbi:acetylornithine and succinylornithine aminotransferase [Denitrovibrio acetiphilus DSM 12809]|uniref:Acetylornithine aminotransferase n=1 Tax=Denitrovibrio acetiphilus (strain DSM 12809 / NBRC 114555 / N2460) TaxID=522772 RepID=D4H2Q7_DENA2|nr:aspartate aminotransferase family protein [Denitrovibrio acetiphilus]ADD67118.1 acetylornithine and succinylornithine aminotransferase [Denitrovibrio acetiphilus DSM 12809]
MSAIFKNYARYPLSFVKGEGCRLTDDKGEIYFDFGSGISVVNLGHSHPAVTESICTQAGTLIHTSNLYNIPVQERLADKLSRRSFGGDVFFCNSGMEANEAALKLARIYGNTHFEGKRLRVITLENSFHGRSYMTLSATGQDKIKKGFEPVADFFTHIPANDFDALKREVDKGDVAAFMLELIQGEGGLCALNKKYLAQCADFCRKEGVMLILDEIQTGFCRTGSYFAYEQFGIEPDVITLAKGIANGVPMGAMIAKPEFAKYMTPGTHGTTFGGNFLACAAALAVFDVMNADGFLEEVNEKGAYMKEALENIFEGTDVTVLGMGMMLGAKIPGRQKEFINKAIENKLLLVPAGHDVVRIYPPLTISQEDLDAGLELISKTATDLGLGG